MLIDGMVTVVAMMIAVMVAVAVMMEDRDVAVDMAVPPLPLLMLHAKFARYMVTQLLIVGGGTRMILMTMVAMTGRVLTSLPMELIQTGTQIQVLRIMSQDRKSTRLNSSHPV